MKPKHIKSHILLYLSCSCLLIQAELPLIRLTPSHLTAFESESAINIPVERLDESTTPLNIPWELSSDLQTTHPQLLHPTKGTLMLSEGQTTGTITLFLQDNGTVDLFDVRYDLHLIENEEVFRLKEYGSTTHITILDNEIPKVLNETFRTNLGDDDSLRHAHSFPGGLLASINSDEVRLLDTHGQTVMSYQIPEPWSGTIDQSFMDEQNRIYLQGNFERSSKNLGVTAEHERIIRLHTNGDWDTSFASEIDDDYFESIYLLKDQSFIWTETPRGRETEVLIRKMDIDGTIDPAFNPDLSGNGYRIVMHEQADGKILAAGLKLSWNRSPLLGDAMIHDNVIRMLPDGSPDPDFHYDPSQIDSVDVRAIAVQGDGKILLGGRIEDQEMGIEGLVRLNADGRLDKAFTARLGLISGKISVVALGKHDEIWIGGTFYDINGYQRHHLALLNQDGSLDHGFNAGLINTHFDWSGLFGGITCDVGEEYDEYVYDDFPSIVPQILLQQDGGVIIHGDFDRINDEPVKLVKLKKNTVSSSQVTFAKPRLHIPEGIGIAEIELERSGNTENAQTLRYRIDRISHPNLDNFEPLHGELEFQPLEIRKHIRFKVPDNKTTSQVPMELEITLSEPTNELEISHPTTTLFLLDDDREGAVDAKFQPALSHEPPDIWSYLYVTDIQPIDPFNIEIQGNFYTANDTSAIYHTYPQRHSLAQLSNQGNISGNRSFELIQQAFEQGNYLKVMDDEKRMASIAITPKTGSKQYQLRRLTEKGNMDPSFHSPSFSGGIQEVIQTPMGNYLVIGNFKTVNGQLSPGVAKLDHLGQWIESFSQNIQPGISNHPIQKASITKSNQLQLFVDLPGDSTVPSHPSSQLSYHDLNGKESFRVRFRSLASGDIHSHATLQNGSTLLFGSFTEMEIGKKIDSTSFTQHFQIPTPYLARLLPDGTPDTSFHPSVDGPVHVAYEDTFGRLYIGGDFKKADGKSSSGLARLNHDGTLDTTFDVGAGIEGGRVGTMAMSQDGRGLYIGGTFTSYDQILFPGLARIQIAPHAQIKGMRRSEQGTLWLEVHTQPESKFELQSSPDLHTWSTQWSGSSVLWTTEMEITPTASNPSQFYRVRASMEGSQQ